MLPEGAMILPDCTIIMNDDVTMLLRSIRLFLSILPGGEVMSLEDIIII